MVTGIVLAGHGSHISPETAGIVWRQVDALRALHIADEVSAAFWKEQPGFSTVLHSFSADDVTIIPLFTASGFFTRTLIPAEMGLTGPVTVRNGRTLRYTPPIGEHSASISRVIDQRIADALARLNAPPDQVGVALIGHGTARDPRSRETTLAQADRVRAAGSVGQVTAVFLDDDPGIPDAYTLLTTPYIIAVPNFLALGSHATQDVPLALGFRNGTRTARIDGRTVIYTDPIGSEASLTEAILDLARLADMPPPTGGQDYTTGLPIRGREKMMYCFSRPKISIFAGLEIGSGWVSVGAQPVAELDDLAMLRDYVRTRPHFRALSSGTDLPGGWRIAARTLEQAHAVLETVYPGAIGEFQSQYEQVPPTPLSETVARQVGAYQALETISEHDTEQVVQSVCGKCIRAPLWHMADPGQFDVTTGKIPCLEACNWWLSKALDAHNKSATADAPPALCDKDISRS